MINKLVTADDHRYVEQKPRPAMNIDVVRRLACAATPEAVLELVKLVAVRFGGLSHLKCLPELAATDPAAADARYHMLPVMVTVVFAPDRVTVGSLLADPAVRAAWAKLRATRPSNGVSTEEWHLGHDTAMNFMRKCDPNEPARMHCEVQVVTTAMADIRRCMHQVYKVVRASNGAQLHADVTKPGVEAVVDVVAILRQVANGDGGGWGLALWEAANDGRIATAKRLLEVCGESGGVRGGTGGSVDVNWRLERTGSTAVWMAAQNGHLSVVLVLLEHGADPNIARTDDGSTPMCIAAQYGHFDIVKLLLENNADPNQAMTDDGGTPLIAAADKGHVDVVTVLLANNADPNQALTTDGQTPVYAAAVIGHVDVVTVLLAKNADPNQATTDNYGRTPLFAAAWYGHIDVLTVLLAKNADPNQATTDEYGTTAIYMAAQEGYLDIIKLLVDAGGLTGTMVATYRSTDLWAACYGGHVDVVKYLLAQPTVEINRRRSDARDAVMDEGDDPHPGTTPLEAAVLEGHTAIADLLKEHGAV